jgi:hypothetical protein
MGKRGRKRSGEAGGQPAAGEMLAPTSVYTNADGDELELRGALSLKARAEYSATLTGGLNQEDAWQRATELLFERLAVAWTLSGVRAERQKELIARYRIASSDERRFVRMSLREHLAENFPELDAP